MTDDQIRALLDQYEAKLVGPETYIRHMGPSRERLLARVLSMRESMYARYPMERENLMRQLGYLEGALWVKGIIPEK